MTRIAIILIVASALIHAGWNFVTKGGRPTSSFFLMANTVGCLILLPAVGAYRAMYAFFTPQVWILIAVTGLFQAVYFGSLAGAYRRGEMSLAYPLARSSPLIVVTVVAVFMGRGDEVSVQCVAGIALIVAGCFMLPMKRFSDFKLANYLNKTCAFALLAAIGTAGYSIVDDEALRKLRAVVASAGPGDGVKITILYAFAEAVTTSLWVAAFIAVRRAGRQDFRETLRTKKKKMALTGVGIYASYTLVLIAMAFARNVSYVVAFRQLSIPLGAILGMTILKESSSAPKILGLAALFTGLILVGTG